MTDWHVVDPWQELNQKNGSAVLRVARELAGQAISSGSRAYVVGGALGGPDLDVAAAVLSPRVERGSLRAKIDRVVRFVSGSSMFRQFAIQEDFSKTVSPSRIVLHNLPWWGREMRSKWPGAELVLYAHNVLLQGVPKHSMRAALQQFDRVVFVSQFLRDEFIERFAMDQFDHPSRVSVIPNALRTDAVFPAVAPLYDVVYVGRLVPEKGVDQLLLAASRDGNQWKIAVVGGKYFNVQPALDPYEERLREIVRSRALDVEFTGPVEPSRVLEFFSKARVAVIPSVWPEPAGLALLEAMASPAAAVATRVGGMPELAPLGSVTWVPPSAPGAIREAVDGLLGDERRRVAQVQRANAAAAGWTWEMAYRLLIE